ncbi:MAG: aminotransferase class I/II-fold pyridoxal phosphate-dependent enzyme [Lachnospiraceae bacterium]|nr:aminotransferase class I/II-fold pyridoxal phosphate-dependent enzyme [Lachnospiraceae bacterium]
MRHGGDIYRNKVNMDFSVNLNPTGTPEEMLNAVREALKDASLYPDIKQEKVRKAIAGYVGTSPECVYAGNGAAELIMAVVRAVRPERTLIFDPAFSGYEHALNAVGCRIIRHTLKEENGFELTRDDLKLFDKDTDMVFICDPVNPTGCNIPDEIIEEILKKAVENDIAVCVDESFMLLSKKALMPRRTDYAAAIREYGKLYIIRSLTKFFAMPGIRMGYVLSSPEGIDKIRRQLPEWNLPVTAEAAVIEGMKLLKDSDIVKNSLAVTEKGLKYLTAELKKHGLKVFDSNTSFLLCKGPGILYEKLLERGVLVRDCSEDPGLGCGFYRIAVKDHESNVKLSAIIGEILDKN